jgi:hypothetical protein
MNGHVTLMGSPFVPPGFHLTVGIHQSLGRLQPTLANRLVVYTRPCQAHVSLIFSANKEHLTGTSQGMGTT